ncbi:MAG: hypothetical protein PHE55_01695 [Methylococcaceae bacterium]|nr:hypothetical protein [Methylococcaceae bacterium]
MRTLIHFPIIHGPEDLGRLGDAVNKVRTQEQTQKHLAIVESVWNAIEASIKAMELDYSHVKIYQDGLPVCGKESEIVADMAKAGSRNHLLLQALHNKGATVMGTESAELLLEEYSLMTQLLQSNAEQAAPSQELGKSLLDRRDGYIARRIEETLQADETGLLFLGLMHSVEDKLSSDITLIQPLGKPKLG